MYSVVGCGDCGSIWIVEDTPDTTTCPRCGTRHRFESLRKLARTEEQAAARRARSRILAERADDVDGLPDFDELDRSVERDRRATTESTASGESGTSREAIVRRGIRTIDDPDEAAIVSFAAERGVPENAARRVLRGLERSGEATAEDGRYRLL